MRVSPTLLIAASLVVAGIIFLAIKPSFKPSSSSVQTPDTNPDNVQIDYQQGVKVLATYLPDESTRTEAKVRVEISFETGDLSTYNLSKIMWADTNVEPLLTIRVQEMSRTSGKIIAKMTFLRNNGSHYHLIVRDLAGVKDRVLHFYGL